MKTAGQVLAHIAEQIVTPALVTYFEGCEAAVTARVRIGWVRFRKCGELLLGNRFPLKMKGKVYCCCVRYCMEYCMEYCTEVEVRHSETVWK